MHCSASPAWRWHNGGGLHSRIATPRARCTPHIVIIFPQLLGEPGRAGSRHPHLSSGRDARCRPFAALKHVLGGRGGAYAMRKAPVCEMCANWPCKQLMSDWWAPGRAMRQSASRAVETGRGWASSPGPRAAVRGCHKQSRQPPAAPGGALLGRFTVTERRLGAFCGVGGWGGVCVALVCGSQTFVSPQERREYQNPTRTLYLFVFCRDYLRRDYLCRDYHGVGTAAGAQQQAGAVCQPANKSGWSAS